MKKRKIYILFLVLLFTLSLSAFTITAQAYSVTRYYYDSETDYNYNPEDFPAIPVHGNGWLWWKDLSLTDIDKTDGPFIFAPGASISKYKENKLSFVLACTDNNIVNYSQLGDYFEFQLTLLRQGSTDSTYIESVTYCFSYDYKKELLTIFKAGEIKQYQSNKFSPVLTNSTDNAATGTYDFKFEYNTSKDPVAGLPDDTKYMRIYFELDSPYIEYSVLFRMNRYQIKQREVWDVWPFTKKTETYTETIEEYAVLSDTRSYYSVLDNMRTAGKIDYELKDTAVYDYCTDVLLGEDIVVDVEYLENINGTPFAKKVKAKATVRAWDDIEELSTVDVSTALNVSGVNTLISACKGFYKGADGVFRANYYSGVYLEAKTVDGKVKQYILDPNKSYADFYKPLVNDGIITQNLYDYEFNEILKKYPALNGFKPEEVYGYFGYIVIPETFSLNQAYAELFNSKLKFDGVVNCFEFEEELSLNSYNKLLKDYNYSWLSRLWNGVWGTLTQLNAKHVVLHADCSTSKAYGSMNGSTEIGNTSGLVGNEIGGAVETIVEELDNVAKDINNLLFGGSGGIPWLLIILLGGVVIYFIQKQQKTKKRRP